MLRKVWHRFVLPTFSSGEGQRSSHVSSINCSSGQACTQWASNYREIVSTLRMMRHADRVNHREGTFFCPNSQSFHAVHIDLREKHPSLSALLFMISSMSSSRLSSISHENRDRILSTCKRSYHTKGTLSLRKSVPM